MVKKDERGAKAPPRKQWGLVRGLMGCSMIMLLAACGDNDGGKKVIDTPNACNDECPDEECQFGQCIGGDNNGDADMGDADMEDDGGDVDMDQPDVEDKTCAVDGDCEDDEFCNIAGNNEEGVCEEGCREGGCPTGEVCDTENHECVDGCVDDAGCGEGEICNVAEGDDFGACADGCRDDEGCGDGEICSAEEGADSGACVEGCRQDDDCGGEEICVNNVCEDSTCTEDTDCPPGLVCTDGECAPQACTEDTDCDDPGQYCNGDGECVNGCRDDNSCAPGEICDEDSRACVEGCREHTDCEAAEFCNDENVCEQGCRDDEQCSPGESCVDTEDGRLCQPTPCATDDACDEGFYCDGTACAMGCREGSCDPGEVCNTETRECGPAPCTDSSQCEEGQYCADGACVPGCDGDERCLDGQPCNLDNNTCGCENNDQCGQGQVCVDGACIGACTEDADCADNEYCDQDTGTCVVGCRDDDLEPNNAPNNSFPVDAGTYNLRMCYGAQLGVDEDDCFSSILNENDSITLMLEVMDLDLDLVLYNPAGDQISLSSNAQGDEMLTFQVNEAGTYSYCVRPQGDSFEGNYRLSVAVEVGEVCQPDVDEAGGNDTCAQVQGDVQEVAVGAPQTLGERTICEGDQDHYAVTMRGGQELTATVTSTGDPVEVEILNLDCGAVLARGVEEGDALVASLVAPADGTYTVKIYGSLANSVADYQLDLGLEAGNAQCSEDLINDVPVEPNQDQAGATILRYTRQQTYEVSNLSLCQMDEDWYQLNITNPGDVIRATLVQGVNEVPLSLEIRDGSGNVLDTANEQAMMKTAETMGLQSAGLYYLRVSPTDMVAQAGVAYQLRVLVTPASDCIPDEFEPNNDFQSAALVDDGDHQAVMCRGDDAEVDWYRVMLFPNDRINIDVSYDHNEDFMFTSVFRPGDDLTGFSDIFLFPGGDPNTDVLSNGAILVGPGQAGEWFIKVEKGASGDPLDYVLGLNIERAECDDELETAPNESCAQAQALSLEGAGIGGRVCGPTGDEDWYSVNVAADQQLVVDLEYLHFQDGNLDMEVYGPDGQTLADLSYNAGPNCEQVVINPTMAGAYCVRVFVTSAINETPYTNLRAYTGTPSFTCNP